MKTSKTLENLINHVNNDMLKPKYQGKYVAFLSDKNAKVEPLEIHDIRETGNE